MTLRYRRVCVVPFIQDPLLSTSLIIFTGRYWHTVEALLTECYAVRQCIGVCDEH
jgi:hypothetical protein